MFQPKTDVFNWRKSKTKVKSVSANDSVTARSRGVSPLFELKVELRRVLRVIVRKKCFKSHIQHVGLGPINVRGPVSDIASCLMSSKINRTCHSLGVSIAKNIKCRIYLNQVAYVIHYNLWMILPFHVQPSISCRYDDKGTFYNIFRLNALSCKKESPSPEFVSRRDAAGLRPREL